MVSTTNTERIKHMSAKKLLKPSGQAIAPATSPPRSGEPKLRFKLSSEVLRQASSGPTPVRKRRNNATGMLTLLKNGGPHPTFHPASSSAHHRANLPDRNTAHA